MAWAGPPPEPPLCQFFGPASPVSRCAEGEQGFVWIVLPRHGRRPAAFLGRELLHADNAGAVRAGVRRGWSDIRIFELPGPGFVTSVRHLHADDGLPRWQDAWPSADATGVVAALCDHDPDKAGSGAQISAWQDLLRAVFGAGPAHS